MKIISNLFYKIMGLDNFVSSLNEEPTQEEIERYRASKDKQQNQEDWVTQSSFTGM